VEKARAYVGSLPPKAPKAPKAAKPRKGSASAG
jgi:hypothetical protein